MKKEIIQKNLLEGLKDLLEDYNKVNKPKLKLDVAVYYLSLFISVPSFYRSDENQGEFVNLSSQKLKRINSNYTKYIDFFTANGFVEVGKNYSADLNRSREYKILNKYFKGEVESYEIKDKVLLNKFTNGLTEEQIIKKKYCEKQRPHLVCSFNEYLTMDSFEAYKEIQCLQNKESYRKYLTSSQMILEWHNKEWKYSIKPSSDNRIHSTLTRTPRVLRKHIRYNRELIIGWDISSSQPYFFTALLKAIYYKDKELLKRIMAHKILGDSVVEKLFDLNLSQEEISDFGTSILNGDFYESFQEKIEIKYKTNGEPYRNVFVKSKGVWEDKVYDSERELVKKVIMEIFYSSSRITIPEAAVFRRAYPSIHKIMTCIKDNGVKFSYLLQYIEAYCLLDYVAFKIYKKYPEMTLLSIHDSLVTTESYKDILKEEMYILLKEITTIKPQLKLEEGRKEEKIIVQV